MSLRVYSYVTHLPMPTLVFRLSLYYMISRKGHENSSPPALTPSKWHMSRAAPARPPLLTLPALCGRRHRTDNRSQRTLLWAAKRRVSRYFIRFAYEWFVWLLNNNRLRCLQLLYLSRVDSWALSSWGDAGKCKFRRWCGVTDRF